MEDVRSLCPRSVVINGGKKLYDGETDKLFARFQTHKKITVTFDIETDFVVTEDAEVIEKNPFKVGRVSKKSIFKRNNGIILLLSRLLPRTLEQLFFKETQF